MTKLIKYQHLSDNLLEEFDAAQHTVESYIRRVKTNKFPNGKTLEVWTNGIIELGKRFIGAEKLYKFAQGMVFSALKQTSDEATYKYLCEDKFNMSLQTADKYAHVYEAWISGTFLYSLRDGHNFFDLCMRDLEYGAGLIVSGDFTEEAEDILFSESNDWQDKRDLIRESTPSVVKRKKRQAQTPTLKITSDGDIYYGINLNRKRIGTLLVGDQDAQIRGIALRAKEVLEREFRK